MLVFCVKSQTSGYLPGIRPIPLGLSLRRLLPLVLLYSSDFIIFSFNHHSFIHHDLLYSRGLYKESLLGDAVFNRKCISYASSNLLCKEGNRLLAKCYYCGHKLCSLLHQSSSCKPISHRNFFY